MKLIKIKNPCQKLINRKFLKIAERKKRETKYENCRKSDRKKRENRAVMWGGAVTWQKNVASLPRLRKLDTPRGEIFM